MLFNSLKIFSIALSKFFVSPPHLYEKIPGSPFKLVVSNLTNMMNNNNGDPSSTVSVHGKGKRMKNVRPPKY